MSDLGRFITLAVMRERLSHIEGRLEALEQARVDLKQFLEELRQGEADEYKVGGTD
jgi:hypothetical protein